MHKEEMIVERPGIGQVKLTWRDDWARLQTYYQVTALRVSGTVTVSAHVDGLGADPMDPDTCRLRLAYGKAGRYRDRYESEQQQIDRPDPLIVNGVTLIGNNYVYPADLREKAISHWLSPKWAPDKTRERAAATLTAIAGHWITRNPAYFVHCLAVVAAAAPGHAEARSMEADRARKRLNQARADLSAAQAAIATAETWFNIPPPALPEPDRPLR